MTLKELTLRNTNVTDAGIKDLTKMKSLTYLDVRGCKKVTKLGVAAVKGQIPKIVIDGP